MLEQHVIIGHVSPSLGLALGRMVQPLVGYVLITRDEIAGLMAGLLVRRVWRTGCASTRIGLANVTRPSYAGIICDVTGNIQCKE
ncbi:MAG: hypothetical protein ACRDHW_15820 [Ktedonobacteraceae bacterium]